MIKKAWSFASHTLSAYLAMQVPQALAQDGQPLAEPFRTDVTEILNGEQGQLTRVSNPTELAESYTPGSSVVVEGDFGLTDRVLQQLQREINENYSHLNILVYLAEDGRSFDEYNGEVLDRNEGLCETNPWLAYLRDSFYSGTDQAGEGNHIIFYLAAKEPGYEYNMVCVAISPQMAELLWLPPATESRPGASEYALFGEWKPLYNEVFSQLRDGFNTQWAIQAFLRGIDARVQEAMRQQEQAQRQHVLAISSLINELSWYRTRLSALEQDGLDLQNSALYNQFDSLVLQAEELLSWDPEYVSRENIAAAQTLVNNIDHSYNQISEALTGFAVSRQRVNDLRGEYETFRDHEYFDRLSTEHTELGLSLDAAAEKINAGDLDYYIVMQEVEENYQNLQRGIKRIDNIKLAQKVWIWGAIAWFLGWLWYLNRRPRRVNSRREFLDEISKLKAGFIETKRVFDEEIEGNTESIEMFFWDQKGITAEKIEELKTSVAYISVILPKIEDILNTAEKAIWISSIFRASQYEEAVSLLTEVEHIIDPSTSEVNKNLLEKINGGEEIRDMTTLIDAMTKTLPELVMILDREISTTKWIFSNLDDASENIEEVAEEYGQLTTRLEIESQEFIELLGPNFSIVEQIQSISVETAKRVYNDTEGQDILWEYEQLVDINEYITGFLDILWVLKSKIIQENPSQYRVWIAAAGYDTDKFLDDIQARFSDLFNEFHRWFENEFNTDKIKKSHKAINDFYNEMRALYEAEHWKVELKWNTDGFSLIVQSAESDIRTQLGDRLQAERLFVEKWNNIPYHIKQIRTIIWKITDAIQSRGLVDAEGHYERGTKVLSDGRTILERSQEIVGTFDNNLASLTNWYENLTDKIDFIDTLLETLKDDFAPELMELRSVDFMAEDSDKTIRNNSSEIQDFLSKSQRKMDAASELFNQWKFLKAQETLEEAYKLLIQADERKREVEGVYENITHVHENNTEKLTTLQRSFQDFIEANSDSQMTQKTSKMMKLLYDGLFVYAPELLNEDKPNPYEIEDKLLDYEDEFNLLQSELTRDTHEYNQYLKYITQAWHIYNKLQRITWEVESDDEPDSARAKKIIGSVKPLGRQLEKLTSHSWAQVLDWYRATDAMEAFIRDCESKINLLHREEAERESVDRDIEKARQKIYKAKRWSGRYVSISSNIWERELRRAHRSFQDGDFSQALRYAQSAFSTASNAISNAESEESRIKRKKAREKAARAAARRASYSSSSSSSSISFGWGWWGGFTGFSWGWGF